MKRVWNAIPATISTTTKLAYSSIRSVCGSTSQLNSAKNAMEGTLWPKNITALYYHHLLKINSAWSLMKQYVSSAMISSISKITNAYQTILSAKKYFQTVPAKIATKAIKFIKPLAFASLLHHLTLFASNFQAMSASYAPMAISYKKLQACAYPTISTALKIIKIACLSNFMLFRGKCILPISKCT